MSTVMLLKFLNVSNAAMKYYKSSTYKQFNIFVTYYIIIISTVEF